MAQSQVRGGLAWHHPMALVLLAHLFLTRERLALRDAHRLLSCLDVLDMLRHKLPAKIISDRTKTWQPPSSNAINDSLKQQSVITKENHGLSPPPSFGGGI
jgi:hypothetical protein